MAAEDQAEDQDLVQYFDIQGKTKPSNSSNWRDWVVSTRYAMPMTGLIDGTGIIRVVHLAIKFIERRGRSDTYNGHYLGTVGDRLEETDPSWVKIKHNALEWTKGKVVTDLGLMSDITQFFDDDNNRFELFTALGGTRGAEVQAPQIPLLPMEIALKIMRTDTTPWDLYKLLLEFEVGKDDLVKEYLLPVKNWTMLASIKRGDRSTMEMTNVYAVT